MNDAVHYLALVPRDPVIARDGRPFGAGLRMKSLDWPYPSVLAGSLRTLLGNLQGGFHRDDYQQFIQALKQLAVVGPFPKVDDMLYFPAPQDIVVRKHNGVLNAFGIRPWSVANDASGCDLPEGLYPVMFPEDIIEDFKPEPIPRFWSYNEMARWLANSKGENFLAHNTTAWPRGFLHLPTHDERMHVQMDYWAGAGVEGMLFQTVGLDLYRFPRADANNRLVVSEDRLALRITGAADATAALLNLELLAPLGGERRLIGWQACAKPEGWEYPAQVRQALQSADADGRRFVRMVLTTPAIFSGGWKPGWLNQEPHGLVGTVPGTQVQVRLIGACVDRWRPISGWSYENNGTKPVRRLAPAGSVYFFRVQSGQCADLAAQWLGSVCDDPDGQDQRDGFGLAIWGVWEPFQKNQKFQG
jgi:CRISPR-associated protein Cmr3